jgi:hypothetical protein
MRLVFDFDGINFAHKRKAEVRSQKSESRIIGRRTAVTDFIFF